MKKLLLLAVAICTILTLTALAQNTGDVPVTSTINDSAMVAGTPFLMQVRSDGGGGYKTTTLKGKYQVESVIQGIGDWELDTGINVTSPTRQVFLDFSKGIVGTGPNGGAPVSPFGNATAALVRPRFLAQSSQSMFTIPLGGVVQSRLIIGFDYPSGQRYRIHMTPDGPAYPTPEADHVDITCTGVGADSQCNRWQIKPNGYWGGCATGDDPCTVKQNVVRLVKVVTSKGKSTDVDQGNFHMSFDFEITRP